VDSGDVTVANPFGVQFQFDDNFSAGFSFASDRSLLNVSLSPMDDVTVSMYTGDVNSELGFGLGVGYDFLVKKSTIFSAMGVYLDWLANGTATADDYDIENGGVFCVGLKAKFGL
ncbi:MAG: hypothetical protein PQJ60_09055, partial [Spirochaetales bacterium]|nr:hypothetical protein [Spirochaetales bacterium]